MCVGLRCEWSEYLSDCHSESRFMKRKFVSKEAARSLLFSILIDLELHNIFDCFVFLCVSSRVKRARVVILQNWCLVSVLCDLQVATNPPPPILELVRENLTTADYNKTTIEQPPSFLDSYHSPFGCFEQTTAANYLINNDGKYIPIITHWHSRGFIWLFSTYNQILRWACIYNFLPRSPPKFSIASESRMRIRFEMSITRSVAKYQFSYRRLSFF